MPFIKYNNKFGRVDPSFPKEVHFDRDSGAAHEDVIITKRDQFSDILFKAANVQLCVNEHTKAMETRPAGDYWGWGGRWAVEGSKAICDKWTLEVEGLVSNVILPKVYRNGLWLNDTNGNNHIIAGSSELYLGWRYDLEGPEAIRPALQQRKDIGFNNLRVFWQKDIFNRNNPWQMPLEKLRPFLALCAEYGMYVEGVILVDCQVVNPNVSAQLKRVNDVRFATTGINNLFEQVGNEYDKNGFDPKNFSQPLDRLSTNASSTEGGKDAKPYWDYFTFSGRRGPEVNTAIREYGPLEAMYTWVGRPCICDEGMKPGIDSHDPLDYYRVGAQARSGVGGRLHTRTGTGDNKDPGLVPSGLFSDIEADSAKWFIEGLLG